MPERDCPGEIVVGIDLGTTNSCVGVYRNNKVEIIANEFTSARLIPSWVSFADDDRCVGEEAKEEALENPFSTIYEIKRLIGRKYDDVLVQKDMKTWPFMVINSGGSPKVEIREGCGSGVYTPEQISAMVLGLLKKNAEVYLGHKISKAVISVPAYFNDSQRQATRDAGEIAGLNVVGIINEPTAAALAFGVDKKIKTKRNVLVYDLGGGTFDVAILEVENGSFKVRAVGGDTHLGGGDFDNQLVEYFSIKVKKSTGIDVASNSRALLKLKFACEKVKIQLSSKEVAKIHVANLFPGTDCTDKIRRSEFENLCSNMFLKTLDSVKSVLADSEMNANDIQDVVLVGGSTRIPKIRKLLREMFDSADNFHGDYSSPISRSINPDEAVAYGAAIKGAMASKEDSVRQISLQDVIPLSLGIKDSMGRMIKSVERNTPVPITEKSMWTTAYGYGDAVEVQIYEGENEKAVLNELLGEFQLVGIQHAKAGVPQFEVTVSVDMDGILHVTAEDLGTRSRNDLQVTTYKKRLTKQEIKAMKQMEQRALVEYN